MKLNAADQAEKSAMNGSRARPGGSDRNLPIGSSGRKGRNLKLVKIHNRALVLRIIQQNEMISRKEISRLTGLTPAAITMITNALLGLDLILESGKDTRGGSSGQKADLPLDQQGKAQDHRPEPRPKPGPGGGVRPGRKHPPQVGTVLAAHPGQRAHCGQAGGEGGRNDPRPHSEVRHRCGQPSRHFNCGARPPERGNGHHEGLESARGREEITGPVRLARRASQGSGSAGVRCECLRRQRREHLRPGRKLVRRRRRRLQPRGAT